MSTPNYTINLDRLRKDLLDLARIGYSEEDCGIYRQGFSAEDMEGRQWLLKKMQELGLHPRVDGAANIIGRLGDADAPAVAIGSHIDTVPCGGMFDGALGVLAGLECVRVLQENQIQTRHPVELIAFSDEEGRFGGMFGAQAMCGQVTPDWLENAEDADGLKLKDAMLQHDLNPLNALNAYREPQSLHAFLELHIEQGPVLDNKKVPIGVVEGISGVFVWIVRLIGKADHSGTAPMDMRSDAFMGLADFAHEIPRIIDEEGTEKSRLTVGKAELKPGFPHTVPGEVMFTLVGRDMELAIMEQMANTCRKALSAIARRHNLMFEYTEMSWLEPHPCHPEIMQVFTNNAKKLDLECLQMPSGAGHDTQFLTEITRAGLIFVPSVGGVSHAPDEWTQWSDVEKGGNVLLHSLLDLAEQKSS